MNEPADIHGPTTPTATYRYAHCNVCNTQWQIQSDLNEDAKACPFCGVEQRGISILSERPTFTSFAKKRY